MAFWNCGIDSDVREVLAQVEEQEPIWVIRQSADTWGLAPLVHASAQVQEWALTDTGPWAINMTFTRHTEDGELDIAVYSSPNQASVTRDIKAQCRCAYCRACVLHLHNKFERRAPRGSKGEPGGCPPRSRMGATAEPTRTRSSEGASYICISPAGCRTRRPATEAPAVAQSCDFGRRFRTS